MTQLRRRSVQLSHGDDDAQHRGHDAQSREGVGDAREHLGNLLDLLFVRLHVGLDGDVDGSRVDAVHQLAQRVAVEVHGLVVREEFGVLLEDRASGGSRHVLFDGKDSLLADLVVQLVLHHQDVHEILAGKSVREDLPDLLAQRRKHVGGRADQRSSDRRPAQNQELRRLDQGQDVSAGHDEAAQNTHDDNDDADDREHRF